MNTRFDDFRSVLRECFSSEYRDVPTDEEKIEYTFSKRFTRRTERLIKRQKSIYWCLINHLWKIVLIFVLLIVILCSTVIYFADGPENVLQNNADPSYRHDCNNDISYNDFAFESDIILDDNGNIIGEMFSDKKASIFNSMLNSFYNFNEAHLLIELFCNYTTYEIECNVDMKNAVSNENVFVSGKLMSYSYSDGKTLTVRSFDVNEFNKDTYPVFYKENEKYLPLSERMFIDEYGDIQYVYKNNVANCPSAKYSLMPQELAFKYLSNFENWEIYNGNTVILGRHCIEIRGKKDVEEFFFTVDSATGILLHYEILENGIVNEYMNVKECSIDEGVTIFVYGSESEYDLIED